MVPVEVDNIKTLGNDSLYYSSDDIVMIYFFQVHCQVLLCHAVGILDPHFPRTLFPKN